MRVRWTPLALADLTAARDWLAESDPKAATRLLREVSRSLARLRKHPLLGRVVPERRALGYRELMLPPYRLVYAVARNEIHVLRFWHARRDPVGM